MVQRTPALDRPAGVSTLFQDGFEHHAGTLSPSDVRQLEPLFAALPEGRPGHRLPPASVASLASVDQVRRLASRHIGALARPVRVLLFDKRDGGNWSLGWHQDRTIEVRKRLEVPGFGPWTMKQGRPHVAPPFSILERMVTARLHIDEVDAENAPLLVAPGSHRLGIVPESRIDATIAGLGSRECVAAIGDVWLYSTPILHASSRSLPGRRRRVVQIDFSAESLPGGLEWADAA